MSGIAAGMMQNAANTDCLGGDAIHEDERRLCDGKFTGRRHPSLATHQRKLPEQFGVVLDTFEDIIGRDQVGLGDEQPDMKFIVVRAR